MNKAWIRAQRLECARRDLANPNLSFTPVHTTAATRWGLVRASDFTRAFRRAFGVSPIEYRVQVQTETGQGPSRRSDNEPWTRSQRQVQHSPLTLV
ncbi:helix-turn-helix domain-containing protein [Streptomyces sp. LUP30]|uniref:helix-turn-helix domain-containing protein n=1 Tax=Streptomyces sp. LUP30 TaxID=1890285 RepID=UPI000851A43C